MRIKALLQGDIRFQFKYGFYYIYIIFSVLYIALLYAFPKAWREKAAMLMIFTDPAAMGLYFMGAIVLFEKSERVLDSLTVSPVKTWEYVLSKLISIGIISTIIGLVIGTAAGIVKSPVAFIAGVFLCSCMFSSVGLIAACKISTLNQFVLATIPAEIVITVPVFLWLFWYKADWLVIHPGVGLMILCGAGGNSLVALVFLILWTALFTFLACMAADRLFKSVGGMKL